MILVADASVLVAELLKEAWPRPAQSSRFVDRGGRGAMERDRTRTGSSHGHQRRVGSAHGPPGAGAQAAIDVLIDTRFGKAQVEHKTMRFLRW